MKKTTKKKPTMKPVVKLTGDDLKAITGGVADGKPSCH